VFERFNDDGRRVVVLAQEEARLLDHNSIGTEHVLLALLRAPETVAAEALQSLDISLAAARAEVEVIVVPGTDAPSGHIPFTPRAKKVLELSLREALQLGHDHIGTEHILLGLIGEGQGVAAQVLVKLGADLQRVRARVIELLARGPREARVGRLPPPSAAPVTTAASTAGTDHCAFCGRDLFEVGLYVRAEAAAICDSCIEASRRAVADASEGQRALDLPPPD
jgi:ATP-dependent Clp protease ATP-binding subunit ClpC